MEKKKVKIMLSAAAVMTAAGSGIFCAWKAGKKKKMAEVRADAPDLEEGLTEEKVRESLLRLFRFRRLVRFRRLRLLGSGLEGGPLGPQDLFLPLRLLHGRLVFFRRLLFPTSPLGPAPGE